MLVRVPDWLLILPSASFQQIIVSGSFVYMGLYLIIILISWIFRCHSSLSIPFFSVS